MATTKDFLNTSVLTGKLTALGLSEPAAADKSRLFSESARVLIDAGIDASRYACGVFVPGRIEVLGKHTDYAGGRSVVTALERGFCLVAAASAAPVVTVRSVATGEQVELPLQAQFAEPDVPWGKYPAAAVRRTVQNFPHHLQGADIAFGSDLPEAAGLSSSSAMIVSVFLAISQLNRLCEHPEYLANIDGAEALAGYLGTVENGQTFGTLLGDKGVGTFGGSQDHTAILCCRPDALSVYSYCPVRLERSIRMPPGYIFAVASSGVIAEKTGSAMAKYNRASALSQAAAEIWRTHTGRADPHLAAAVTGSAEALDELRAVLRTGRHDRFSPAELLSRFEHFVSESEQIIPQAADALAAADIATFGRCVDLSQWLAESLLGNQVPETIYLARTARQLGAQAASAFGAGFGGAVWALVAADHAEDLLAEWRTQYEQAFADRAEESCFFLSQAGPAAAVLSRPD